jgi:N-hydroxyarylamine O-acetyltransferase
VSHSIGPPSNWRKSVTATIDLDAYFQRIHWSGGRDPTLETLAGLIEAHTAHIPFENLDVLLGRTVRLDLDGLQDKIVGARRPVRRRARGARFQGRPSRRASCSVWALDRSEADPRVHDRGGRGRDLCCRSRLWSVRTPLSGAACGFVSGPDNYWMQRDGNFWVLHVTRGNGEPVAGWRPRWKWRTLWTSKCSTTTSPLTRNLHS